jgi:nucleoporin NUP159
MMVNRLGLTVRGMTAYHMAQTQPIADCKHESAKDMKQSKDWKFCELEKVRKILEEVLDGVKKENKGNEELEAQYEAANKGFIKRSLPIISYQDDSLLFTNLKIVDTKDAEIKRLLAVHNDPRAAALARARTLTSEQHLQQIKLRKEYTRVEKLLKDAEKEVTQLKAKIASRDKNNAGTVVPPTVEAVRNTIMKLTGMVERKNGDIEYLADRLNRVKLKSRSISVTPSGRSRLMSPDIGIRSEAPSMRFSTPERGLGSSIGPSFGSVPTPVLTLTDPTDVAVAREEKKARREMGNRLRGVLEKNGPRVTGGQGQGNYFMK